VDHTEKRVLLPAIEQVKQVAENKAPEQSEDPDDVDNDPSMLEGAELPPLPYPHRMMQRRLNTINTQREARLGFREVLSHLAEHNYFQNQKLRRAALECHDFVEQRKSYNLMRHLVLYVLDTCIKLYEPEKRAEIFMELSRIRNGIIDYPSLPQGTARLY
jgi:hypothetical protein